MAEDKFKHASFYQSSSLKTGRRAGEGIIDRDHDAGHGDADAGFDQQDSVMLAVRGMMGSKAA